MKPVLYASNENNFGTYGIGTLSDAVSCVVTEERNGQFELVMTYPVHGKQYSEIQAERILKAKARPICTPQLFRIYRISKPLRGLVTVYAQHISYDLSGIALAPFTGSYSPTTALSYILTDTGFTGTTDKTGSKTFGTDTPKSVRSMLGGTDGSLLDQWGGEFEFDNFDIKLLTNRGQDRDVIIEYGKNLTELLADHDLTEVYSELLPYATYLDDDGVQHTVVGNTVTITSVISRTKTLIKDFTYELGLDTQPTVAQIDAAAAAWLSDHPLGHETPSLTVSFVDGEHPANYPVVPVDLCDTVTIRYTALGVNVKAKIVKAEYNVLLNKYNRLTIGKPRASMIDTVASIEDEVKEVNSFPSQWASAIAEATQLITGNLGGHLVIKKDSSGKPQELLIMDTEDITTAQKVWRWNLSGLGYSSNGYNGTYGIAITNDGKINASFVLTGTLIASIIKAGILQDDLGKNSWDLDTGRLTITDGVITATHTETIDHSDYSQTDLDLLDDYMAGNAQLTDQEKAKYDIDGDGLLDEDDYNRIDWMITNSQDIDRTITTVIDPSTAARAIQISTSVPATGTVPARTISSYYSGAQTQSNTLRCDRITFTGDTHAAMIANEFDPEVTLGQPTIRPWGHSEDDVSIPNDSWKTANYVCLPPGVWYLHACARFNTSSTGRRMVCISYTQNNGDPAVYSFMGSGPACSGARTSQECGGLISLSQETNLYLNCYQNSGSAKSTYVSLTAMRYLGG